MSCPPIDLAVLEAVFAHMAGRVTYKLGAKADNYAGCPAGPRTLDEDSSAIVKIDCSGFVRYALYRATAGALIVPDGSANQHAWARDHLRELQRYSDVQYAAGDASRLFIAFMAPNVVGVGHVWFVRSGATMESHSGVGVDSRPWDTPILVRIACAAYELPTV